MTTLPLQISSVTINHISENAILIEWPEVICEKQHQHIMFCQEQIKNALLNNLHTSIASYASLIIYYDADFFQHMFSDNAPHLIIQTIRDIVEESHSKPAEVTSLQTVINIPVYYGEDSGWDLNSVAQRTTLSVAEVIKQHTQTTYRAYALGFTPGFCYLGQLPPALELPRKKSPRLNVPKGAVAIAGKQTAVYPNTSPGGWHILGQTPVEMTMVDSTTSNSFSTTINVGQQVKFNAINQSQFLALGGVLQRENL